MLGFARYTWFDWIGLLTDLTVLLPVIASIIYLQIWKKSFFDKLLLLIVATILLKTCLTFITSQLAIRNILFYNWFAQIEYSLIAIIFYDSIRSENLKNWVIVGSMLALMVSFVDYDLMFNVSSIDLNQRSMVAWGLVIISFVVFYFYELIRQLEVPVLLQYPLFWCSTGVLLYFSGTIFSYIYCSFTFNSNNFEVRKIYWTVEFLFSIVLNIFLTISIWNTKNQQGNNR
jgi:hypothetical protein